MNSSDFYENLSVCEKCGKTYLNFCVPCAKKHREELVEQLMNEHGLTLEALIEKLATEVGGGKNFAALKLAIEMRSMKPPTRTDVTTDGNPIVDPNVKTRLVDKIARLFERGPEKQSD